MNFANVGVPVKIVEVQQAALDRGLGVIRKNYQNSADKGRFPQEEVGVRMGLLQGSLARADLADCDLVIEAVFEDMAVKKEIFADLDRICKPGAILATNTSALDINEIASVVKRPQDVIGLHFFSPANVMKLLEIVRARHTSDSVVATSMDLARKIGKVAVLAGVCPGFIGNRILYKRGQPAQFQLKQGAMPWDIDAAFNAFGFKMGPFQMSDLAGLDIGWKPGAKTANPLRDMICERTMRRGQKSGAGYYDYDENRVGRPSPEVAEIVKDFARQSGAAQRTVSREEILEECIFPMINEGAAILEEGMAQRPGDIDVTWLNGYGWPQDKGGPMFLGDKVGLRRVVEVVERVSKNVPDIKVSGLLRSMVKVADLVEKHLAGIVAHWKWGLTNAFMEGLNSVFSATKRKTRRLPFHDADRSADDLLLLPRLFLQPPADDDLRLRNLFPDRPDRAVLGGGRHRLCFPRSLNGDLAGGPVAAVRDDDPSGRADVAARAFSRAGQLRALRRGGEREQTVHGSRRGADVALESSLHRLRRPRAARKPAHPPADRLDAAGDLRIGLTGSPVRAAAHPRREEDDGQRGQPLREVHGRMLTQPDRARAATTRSRRGASTAARASRARCR
jgi:3-hydroxyacyl-CoA dehydrogenase